MPSQIFISYRRDDAAGYARAVHEELSRCFGVDRVFIDVDDIDAGQPFSEVIGRSVGDAAVLLVLIGKRWQGERAGAPPRICDSGDLVARRSRPGSPATSASSRCCSTARRFPTRSTCRRSCVDWPDAMRSRSTTRASPTTWRHADERDGRRAARASLSRPARRRRDPLRDADRRRHLAARTRRVRRPPDRIGGAAGEPLSACPQARAGRSARCRGPSPRRGTFAVADALGERRCRGAAGRLAAMTKRPRRPGLHLPAAR